MSKQTQDEIHEFAEKHAPNLSNEIIRLCGQVISKGIAGILEEILTVAEERNNLLLQLDEMTRQKNLLLQAMNRIAEDKTPHGNLASSMLFTAVTAIKDVETKK